MNKRAHSFIYTTEISTHKLEPRRYYLVVVFTRRKRRRQWLRQIKGKDSRRIREERGRGENEETRQKKVKRRKENKRKKQGPSLRRVTC